MLSWRRLTKNRLLDVGAGLLALVGLVKIAGVLPERSRANDFAHYFVSGRLLLAKVNPYQVPLGGVYLRAEMNPYENLPYITDPPSLLWLTAPLGKLPVRVAFGIWVALEVGLLGLVLWLTWRQLGERLGRRGFYFLCCGTLCSAPVFWHFYFSQVQLFLAALLLASYAAHRAGNEWLSCTGVAVAALVKLFPAVLVPWFVWRGLGGRWGRVRRAVHILTLIVGGVLATGPDLWRQFFVDGLPLLRNFAAHNLDSFSLASFFAKVIAMILRGSGSSPVSMDLSAAVALAVLIMVVVFVCFVRGAAPENWEMEFSGFLTLMVVCSLVAWGHYLVFMIFPMAVVATRLSNRPKTWEVLGYIILLVCLNCVEMWVIPVLDGLPVWKLAFCYLPLYAMLGLVMWIFVLSRQDALSNEHN